MNKCILPKPPPAILTATLCLVRCLRHDKKPPHKAPRLPQNRHKPRFTQTRHGLPPTMPRLSRTRHGFARTRHCLPPTMPRLPWTRHGFTWTRHGLPPTMPRLSRTRHGFAWTRLGFSQTMPPCGKRRLPLTLASLRHNRPSRKCCKMGSKLV